MTFFSRRLIPMRCASRVNVEHSKAVPLDVDLFAASKTPFEILGKNTGCTEPPDQLPARFRTRVEATLIDQDGGCDIAETPSNAETTVSVGQGLPA